MSKNEIFDVLIFVGRPASGKSELIRYLQALSPKIRKEKFHVGNIKFIDDFPFLWTWYEEDHIRKTKLGLPQVHYDADGYFLHVRQWDLLIERIGLEYAKLLIDNPAMHDDSTALVEFSRGSQHGGYSRAIPKLSDEILERAAIVYVNVSFEESLRKNQARFNPDRPYSILQHSLPDERLRYYYTYDDWGEFTNANTDAVEVNGHNVPYAVFENEDDVTTDYSDAMVNRLYESLGGLWAKLLSMQTN